MTPAEARTIASPRPLTLSYVTAAVVSMAVFAADQISKNLAVGALLDGPVDGPGPFWFRLVANRGVLMGFPLPGWTLVAAVVGVLTVAAHSLRWAASRTSAAGWGLVVGGAFGNLTDRVQHRPRFPDHAVVDWIASSTLPTFNLADVAILAGVILLAAAPDWPNQHPESKSRSFLHQQRHQPT